MRAGGCEADSDEVGRDASPPEGRDVWGAHSMVDPMAAVEAKAEAAEMTESERTGRQPGGPPKPGQQARKGPRTHTIPACIKASFPEGRDIWGVHSTVDSAAAVEVEAVETAGPNRTGRLPGGLPETAYTGEDANSTLSP